MLRYMSPYLLLDALLVLGAGVGYGTGAFGVPVTYALLFAGILIAGVGYVRWDEHQHPHNHR